MADTIFTQGPQEKSFPSDAPMQQGFDREVTSVLSEYGLSKSPDAPSPIGATFQQYLKSEEDYIQKTEETGQKQIQDRVFEQGLSGDVDFNTLFDQPLIEDKNKYELLKEAKKAETAGNASPDQVAMLNDARTGTIRQDYDYLLPSNQSLYYGIQETGQFPIDLTTGKVMVPPSVPEGSALEARLEDKAKDAAHLKAWMEARPDAPTNPVVRKALLQSIEADLGDVFAERMYSLANATKEGVGFYLPYYTGYAYNKIVGNDTSEYTDEKRYKELMEFRDNYPAFADRQTVMNDILREQIKLRIGQAEFDRLGLGEKVTVDGVEQYKVNFVGEQFANDMFEELFNMQSFGGKLSVLIGENIAATKAITAPFTLLGNTSRAVRRGLKGGDDVPFNLMSTEDAAALVRTTAQMKGVPLSAAAKELAQESASASWWGRWRANSLANVIAGRAGSQEVIVSQVARSEKVQRLQYKLNRAINLGLKDTNIRVLENQLSKELALQNWATVKKLAPYAREWGINPTFDVAMATSQIIGRNMAPENPQMGELYGALTMLGGYGTGKLFKMTRVPLVGGIGDSLAFRVKVGVEALAGGAFSLMGAAKRGYAEGWLVNPNLKAVVNIPEDLKKNLSVSELRAFDKFTQGLINMDPRIQDVMLTNMSQSFDDMDTIVRSLPRELRGEARSILTLSLGQASGLNFFYSVAASMDAAELGVKGGDIAKIRKNIEQKIKYQVDGDTQLAALSLANDRMNRFILRLRESGDSTAVAAVDRLELLSSSFKSAYAHGVKQQELFRKRNLEAVNKVIEDLSNPNLAKTPREQAIFSGQVEQLIELLNRADTRFNDQARDFAGQVDTASGQTAPISKASMQAQQTTDLKTSAQTADQALLKLNTATITAVERTRLPSNAAEVARNSNGQLISLVNLARINSRNVVDQEYLKISTEKNIEFDLVASNVFELFRAYRVDMADSIAKAANPITAKALGGTAGVRMMNGMNAAAGRGMNKLFSDELVLTQLSEATGMQFATAADVIQYFKNDYYGTNPRVLAELGVQRGDQISNLQLALKIIDDNELPMSARNLSFIASPKEMEDLRQASNVLIKDKDPAKSRLGKVVQANIDETVEAWGQGLNASDYNQLARARTLARIEAQRFDEGTLGYDIDRMTAGDFDIITGGGDTAKLTKSGRQVVSLLKPLVENIVNPTPQSAAIVQTQLQRLSTTFASLSPSLADTVLRTGPDGKMRVPTGIEISEGTTPVFDLNGFNQLRAILTTAIKNEFFESRNMFGISRSVRINQVPSLNPNDLPREIRVPEQFDGNLQEYLESIEESFVFTVRQEDGSTKQMKLFDTDDILYADREITNVVNAVEEFQTTHSDLLSVAKTAASDMDTTEAVTQELRLTNLAEVNKSSKTTVGREFFDKVIMSGDANEMSAYLSRTEAAIGADKMQDTMQALFVETLKGAGEYGKGYRTVKLFNGQDVPVDSYQRPDIIFSLLDDAISGESVAGRNIQRLADAAGVDGKQLETLRAIFRMSTKMQAPELQNLASQGKLQQTTKGFTLDNTLSKAFNLARGMVSKEYVAAEVALRYAALSKGKVLALLVKDPRSSEIVYNVLRDETRVTKDDALYLGQAIMKFIAGDLSRAGVNFDEAVADREYIENYWKSQGMVFDVEPEFFGPMVP